MEDIKNQLSTRLKDANNVLVAVTNNPTVDQLAAAISLTLILNKLNKHATTVFSGVIPSTIEFLKPEKTIEKNTDSLRDFIISLDKTKADKLRYKIEDQFVKIFITPYHTSISESDLVFSQGDFNVDVVIGLGVQQREELDQAITSHGRILHDATVATVTTDPPSTLGSINYADKASSSLCEILVGLVPLLTKDSILDEQISTALLTGIVAETQRFSNQKTTAATMTVSSKLLAAGANQQLVAKELTPKEQPKPEPPKPPEPAPPPQPPQPQPLPPVQEQPKPPQDEEGTLEINHKPPVKEEDELAQVLIDEQGTLKTVDDTKPEEPVALQESTPSQPPTPAPETPPTPTTQPTPPTSEDSHSLISKASVSSLEPLASEVQDAGEQPDSLNSPPNAPPNNDIQQDIEDILNKDEADKPEDTEQPSSGSSPKIVIQPPPQPHLRGIDFTNPAQPTVSNLGDVRSAVDSAIASGPNPIIQPPIQALNANPIDLNLGDNGINSQPNGAPGSLTPPPVPPPILPPEQTAI